MAKKPLRCKLGIHKWYQRPEAATLYFKGYVLEWCIDCGKYRLKEMWLQE